MSPQTEVTNNRPKDYSKWHRYPNLPYWCYQTDGEFFEQRIVNNEMTVIAYIETLEIPYYKSPSDYPIWDSKKALAKQIASRMNIPAFYVWHTKDCKVFFVKNVTCDKIIKMYEKEYKEFIKKL